MREKLQAAIEKLHAAESALAAAALEAQRQGEYEFLYRQLAHARRVLCVQRVSIEARTATNESAVT